MSNKTFPGMAKPVKLSLLLLANEKAAAFMRADNDHDVHAFPQTQWTLVGLVGQTTSRAAADAGGRDAIGIRRAGGEAGTAVAAARVERVDHRKAHVRAGAAGGGEPVRRA